MSILTLAKAEEHPYLVIENGTYKILDVEKYIKAKKIIWERKLKHEDELLADYKSKK